MAMWGVSGVSGPRSSSGSTADLWREVKGNPARRGIGSEAPKDGEIFEPGKNCRVGMLLLLEIGFTT